MKTMWMCQWALTMSALLAVAPGCGDGGGGGSAPAYELTLSSDTPLPVEISRVAIEIPVGVVARISAFDSDGNPVGLIPESRDVLEIESTPNGSELVLIGASVGETCVDVILQGGGSVPCIPANVTEQR